MVIRIIKMPKSQKKYFFDAVTLSNFALAQQNELFINRYGSNLLVTTEVRDEITNGIVAGYHSLLDIELAISNEQFVEASMAVQERKVYIDLLRYMGAGEASCIACAQFRKGVVVSDDKAARVYCSNYDIIYTGTIGILKACCIDGSLSVENADNILHEMIQCGFYSPVQTISDIL